MHCGFNQVPCRIESIFSIVDKKTGEAIPDADLSYLKAGQAAIVIFSPECKFYVEEYSKFPPFGRVIVRDCNLTVAVGIVHHVLT